jgi:Inner membrane protein YgaP-like, transmembrane domain
MLIILFYQWDYAMYALLILFLLEAFTNWRVPILISRLRFPNENIKVTEGENKNCTLNYEAERMLRLIVFTLIVMSYISFTAQLFWFFPWFVGLMLILAGVTGICPMVMILRWAGLK